jgi:acyl dehydratase
MGPAVVSYRFPRLPSVFRYFPRAVFGRRHGLVPPGSDVPRLEGGVATVRASGSHLARYRDVCGFPDDGCLPITYPHVLAMPLQFAILTHPCFVVRLMGLIHVANDIEQARALPAAREYGLRSWIEGHRDSERGHEFDLYTSLEDSAGTAWLEKSTLLARRTATARSASRSARQVLRYEKPAEGDRPVAVDIDVPRSAGRRYGWLSGDLNPIHLADLGARLFGFERAVAHGMWSIARTFAALGAAPLVPPVRAQVKFRFPVFMPANVQLVHWSKDGCERFVLKDRASDRPHLTGSARRG